ncbi:MAG TPA: DUF3107 domain-containing protein [Acidimicrobiales bacterium]|nr:DUF3107 domain-containing protein [Acidimicrobiales bacterium]
MEVRIGVTYSPRELEVDLGDGDRDKLLADVEKALAGESVLWLTDRKGRTVGVPSAKIAYVEINPAEERRVGFSA